MGFTSLKPSFKRERVWLTGIRRLGQTNRQFQASFQELNRLVDTAGGEIVGESHQSIEIPNPKTFLGKGKVEEILDKVQAGGIDSVAIDDELTPTQNQNLEKMWNVKVLDRTAVILDIFAKRAHTKEGRLQVELAQLQYMQPRLKRMWSHLGQQGGGIGMKGPGETQLEVDKRRVRERICLLRDRLEDVRAHRLLHRQKRESVPLPVFALVGYTNAGKSTLFNALTKSEVFVEDKLFATLDPTVRKLKLPGGRKILLADTVGFIRKLPHTLIEAFKATFEEVAFADGLIHVVDTSDEEVFQQIETVEKVLAELHLNHKPSIIVFNKKDRGSVYSIKGACVAPSTPLRGDGASPSRSLCSLDGHQGIPASALTGEGLEEVVQEMERLLSAHLERVHFFLPHTRGDILTKLYTLGHVLSVEHRAEGTEVDCEIDPKFVQKYQEFLST